MTAKTQYNKLWNKIFCICVTWLCLLHLPATLTSRISYIAQKSTCFVRSICLHVSAVFLTKQKSLGWSKKSKHVHIISQQKGAHLIIPNVCCLFFGPHGSLSKGKEIFDSVAWEEGKENLPISLSHARTRAPEFLSPSLSKACHSDFLFFLIVYDVLVTCASFCTPIS